MTSTPLVFVIHLLLLFQTATGFSPKIINHSHKIEKNHKNFIGNLFENH